MILLERTLPLMVQKEEALLKRLPPHHPKRPLVSENLEKAKAGFRGEENLDYHLSFLPVKEYHIFNALRLHHDGKAFQIDTFIVTPSLGIIIECKNIAGKLIFEKFNQMIRIKEKKEQGFQYPLAQAERQLLQLQRWLTFHKFPPLPLEYIICISNSSTILINNTDSPQVSEKVMHAIHIPGKVKELNQRYSTPVLSSHDMKRLSRLLCEWHEPLDLPILTYYQLSENDILKGVHCPLCQALPMQRIPATWYCPNCKIQIQKSPPQSHRRLFPSS